jgi:hypothetical protein
MPANPAAGEIEGNVRLRTSFSSNYFSTDTRRTQVPNRESGVRPEQLTSAVTGYGFSYQAAMLERHWGLPEKTERPVRCLKSEDLPRIGTTLSVRKVLDTKSQNLRNKIAAQCCDICVFLFRFCFGSLV